MALNNFEIAVGGLTSIPAIGGLVFLSFKTWGERNLDASKLKPKKPQPPATKQEVKQKPEATKKTDSTNDKILEPETTKPNDASITT